MLLLQQDIMTLVYIDYIKKLPMFTVKEIHVSGTLMNKEKKIIDSHTRLARRDYKIIESLLDKFENIDKITLEYTPLYDKQKEVFCYK